MKDSDNQPESDRRFGTPGTTSTNLLRQVKAGERAAWDQLLRLYAPLVAHWCKRVQLQAADAEEIAQEVFQTVYVKIAEFRRERAGSFRKWLKAITRHKIGDLLRKIGKNPRAAGGTDANMRLLQVPELDDSEESDRVERRVVLEQARDIVCQNFQPRSWAAFERSMLDCEPVETVAVELGMSKKAVYVARSKILRFLRQELGGLLD